jgi:hypothetical protein
MVPADLQKKDRRDIDEFGNEIKKEEDLTLLAQKTKSQIKQIMGKNIILTNQEIEHKKESPIKSTKPSSMKRSSFAGIANNGFVLQKKLA